MSILVLELSWWGRENWLLCLVCLPGVPWLLCCSSSRCHGLVCSLWLWYFLIILTYYFCDTGFLVNATPPTVLAGSFWNCRKHTSMDLKKMHLKAFQQLLRKKHLKKYLNTTQMFMRLYYHGNCLRYWCHQNSKQNGIRNDAMVTINQYRLQGRPLKSWPLWKPIILPRKYKFIYFYLH